MSHVYRRQVLRAGMVGLANFVFGNSLTSEAQAETRRGIFDAHLHIPSDNGEVFQWNLVTRTMPEFVAYLDKCGVALSPRRTAIRRKHLRITARAIARWPSTWTNTRAGSAAVA